MTSFADKFTAPASLVVYAHAIAHIISAREVNVPFVLVVLVPDATNDPDECTINTSTVYSLPADPAALATIREILANETAAVCERKAAAATRETN